MTYAELIQFLNTVPEERLQDDVTVRIDDEFFAVTDVKRSNNVVDDVLDPGHVFLAI
jgi:hypothetical protein